MFTFRALIELYLETRFNHWQLTQSFLSQLLAACLVWHYKKISKLKLGLYGWSLMFPKLRVLCYKDVYLGALVWSWPRRGKIQANIKKFKDRNFKKEKNVGGSFPDGRSEMKQSFFLQKLFYGKWKKVLSRKNVGGKCFRMELQQPICGSTGPFKRLAVPCRANKINLANRVVELQLTQMLPSEAEETYFIKSHGINRKCQCTHATSKVLKSCTRWIKMRVCISFPA